MLTENWNTKNVAIAEDAKPNTVTQRKGRSLKTVEHSEQIVGLHNALSYEERARGGSYVLVRQDRARLRFLDTEKFRTSPQDDLDELEQRALDDLRDQAMTEAIRKAGNNEAVARAIERVRGQFSNVTFCWFPPLSQHSQQEAA
jgi:hypothetical protein